jgi:thioredoxin-related protein
LKFRDYNFKYIAPDGQGRGVHELAVSLLDGKLGYPSIVYLTSGYERILISPGYKDVTGMMKELTFVRDDIYKSKSFEEYKAGK